MGKKKKAPSSTESSQGAVVQRAHENATFQAACAKIQENTQKHLERMRNMVGDDEHPEEVLIEEESILDKLSEGFAGNKQETQDILSNLLSGGCSVPDFNVFDIASNESTLYEYIVPSKSLRLIFRGGNVSDLYRKRAPH